MRIYAAVATVLLISTSVLATGDAPPLPGVSVPRGACAESTGETASAAASVAAAREALRAAEEALGAAGSGVVEQAQSTASGAPAAAATAAGAAREAARDALDALLADDAPDVLAAALLAEAEARLAFAAAALETASRLPAEAEAHAQATAADAMAAAGAILADAQAALEEGPGPINTETLGERVEEAAAGADAEIADEDAAARALARRLLLAPPIAVWTSWNDGEGSCLDADRLDGHDAQDFLDLIDAEAARRAAGDAELAAGLAAEADERRAGDAALDARTRRLEESGGDSSRLPTLGVGTAPRARGVTLEADSDLVIETGPRPTITRATGQCTSGVSSAIHATYRVAALFADGAEGHPSAGRLVQQSCLNWWGGNRVFVTLEWTRVDGAAAYRVYRQDSFVPNGSPQPYVDTTATTLTDWGVEFRNAPTRVPQRFLLGARISDDVSYVGGSLGVGTTAPREELDVMGDAKVEGRVQARVLNASSGVVAAPAGGGGGNVAMTVWTTTGANLVAGRVVELVDVRWGDAVFVDYAKTNLSKRVVGVLVSNPTYQLGMPNSRAPVALAGVAQVVVTGPVSPGDSLVTSHVPGVAKACPAGADCAGAVFARALTQHAATSPDGLIYVLVGSA